MPNPTPRKPRRRVERETPEFASMLRRMIRSYGKRVAQADDIDLAEMVAMRAILDEAIADAVAGQRANGASWADVARGLGTSRQYAQRTYGAEAAS